jgi:subtilase family serine protease
MWNVALSNPQASEVWTKTQPGKREPDSKADLVIDKFEPTGGRANEDFYFDVTVRNRNDVAAGGFNVEVRGFGVKNGSGRIEGLGPKQRATVRVGPVNVPFQGNHSYQAHADSKNEVDEAREGNNRAYKDMFIFDPWAP